MPDDVSSRILAAATLAEQAAAALHPGEAGWVEMSREETQQQFIADGYELKDARVLAASGPSHWGAVAAGLRATAALHAPVTVGTMSGVSYSQGKPPKFMSRSKQQCRACYGQQNHDLGRYPCPSIAAVLPLVDQIIRDLGDGQ